MVPIRVCIADDHQLVRESLAMMFREDQRFTVSGQCSNGAEAIKMARTYQSDILLMDINMPGVDGFAASECIIKESPNVKILAVSMNAGTPIVRKMMRMGVMGYVTKNSPSDELKKAVIELSQNRRYICNEIKDQMTTEIIENDLPSGSDDKPSKRQLEILCKVAEGFTSIEIGQQLQLAVKTVETHRYNARKKLKLKNTSAIIFWLRTHNVTT